MDQDLFASLALLVFFVSCLALGTVLVGVAELAFFRQQGVGQAAKQRKQYVNNVVKVTLSSGAGALVAIVFLEPDLWREVLPGFSTYVPVVSLLAVIIVAIVSYKLEVASEVPATLHDLHTDLRKFWAEEEILGRHSLLRHKSWLESLRATSGGRSMTSSKRPLDPRFQTAIDLSLNGNYRDVRFTRLARRTTIGMLRAMILGHPWRTLWLMLPWIAAVLDVALLTTYLTTENHPATPGPVIVSVATIVIGILLSGFNFWARSTSGLRKYCDLKRREELCTLMLNKLKVLAASSKTTGPHQQAPPPGVLRRLLRSIW